MVFNATFNNISVISWRYIYTKNVYVNRPTTQLSQMLYTSQSMHSVVAPFLKGILYNKNTTLLKMSNDCS